MREGERASGWKGMGTKEREFLAQSPSVMLGNGRCPERKARVDDRQAPCEMAEGGRHDGDPTQLASAGARADHDEAGTLIGTPRINHRERRRRVVTADGKLLSSKSSTSSAT